MRVVVTGLGCLTPLGTGVETTWSRLLKGHSGIVSTKSLDDYHKNWHDIPCKVLGKIPDYVHSDHFSASEARRLALFAQYGMVAAEEALKDAKLDLSSVDKRTVGVTVGSGIGSFHDAYDNAVSFHDGGYKKIQPLFIPRLLTNMAAGNITIKYGLKGPNHAVATACATGLHSIGDGYNFIRNGYSKVMISGSAESSIHPLALGGFARARSVVTDFNDEPETASRPFDRERNGFVLSEGAGIVILEELDHALARGVKPEEIYGEIMGYGLSSDGYHITAPPENGEGARASMEMALTQANIDASQIDYINAHATSTKIGDKAEANAIHDLFGANKRLAVSSTKSSVGHLLGAAGSVESIFTLKALKHRQIPPTINLGDSAEFDQYGIDLVPNVAREKTVNYALNNSFGFGGVNSAIIFKQYA